MTQIILSDENCEGQAEAIFRQLTELGYVELLSIEFKVFRDTDLSYGADDETVWQFCQEHDYLLLTGNRTTKDGIESLELTVRRLVTSTSLPVLTIGNLNRIFHDSDYCERCAERLAEIVIDIEIYRGITRLYL